MYIFGFFVSLFRPKNFLATLYFLANLAIIYFLFGYFNIFKTGAENEFMVNGLIGIGINFVTLFITMSPVGEAVWRRYFWAVRVTDESQELLKLFNEVYDNARAVNPKIGEKIKLYFVNSNECNAFSMGRRTIVVTTALLNCDAYQIAGVLAHEFGHISRRDGDVRLGIIVNNDILFVFMLVIKFIINFIGGMISGAAGLKRQSVIVIFIDFVLLLAFRLWTALGNLLLAATSRKSEYIADEFAVKAGYAKGLYDWLNIYDGKRKHSFMSLINASHPATENRLFRIKTVYQAIKAAT